VGWRQMVPQRPIGGDGLSGIKPSAPRKEVARMRITQKAEAVNASGERWFISISTVIYTIIIGYLHIYHY